MSHNIWATILALAVYLASGGGGKSMPAQPVWSSPPTYDQSANGATKTVKISTEIANMRREGRSGSPVVGTLTKGTLLFVEDENGGWYKVRTSEGKTGWVARWMTKPSVFIPSHANPGWEIVGYYAENYQGDPRAYASFTGHLDKITAVAPFLYHIDGYGNILGRNVPGLLSTAKAHGIRSLALVNNTRANSFNTQIVHQMLSSSTARSRAVNGILRLLTEEGFSGVNIDFEGVPAGDRDRLTAFFKELSAVLRPKGLLVTASLPAKTGEDFTSNWGGAYDYADLAPYLDQVMIMTYDQHFKDGPPGPVAAINWVERVLKYATRFFPAKRTIMGIAAYGYDWTARSGKALTYSGVQQLIRSRRITPRWHPTYQVPYFTYYSRGVKHEVWYENKESTAIKVRLAAKYGLKGVAVWRLGYEDPGIWQVL